MSISQDDYIEKSGVGASDSQAANKQPNIVFVLADQLRYQSCGYAGDSLAKTPNIDNLAKEGINFQQAVSSMPVCSACRASLLTGKYTSSTGMVINELRMNTNHTSLAQCLTQGGYETAYIGKWHLYANQLGHHNSSRNSHIPPGPDRLGFDDYWAGYNFHHKYYNSYYHTDSPKKIFFDKKTYEPDGQTDLAIEYINKSKEKPFFLMLSVGTPHDPWTKRNVPKEYYDMFKDVDFPEAPNYSETKDTYGDSWSNIRFNSKKIDKWKKIYYAMTANLDWNVGRLRKAIEEAGIAENTIFVFSSDHGEMFGAHGRMKKNIFYEEAVRVPFLMSCPSILNKGKVTNACMNSVDIMPTLLSLAGVPIPEEVEGIDRSDMEETDEDHAYLMNTGACAAWQNGHEWRGLRTPQYCYAVFRGDKDKKLAHKELLFDIQADPYQLEDLSEKSEYQKVMSDFRNKLESKMSSINDTFPESTWYRDNWIENRIIMRTATISPVS